MTTSTPKTDAAQFIQHDMAAAVDADFSRELERELAAERARLDWLLSGNLVRVRRDSGTYSTCLHYRPDRAAVDRALNGETK